MCNNGGIFEVVDDVIGEEEFTFEPIEEKERTKERQRNRLNTGEQLSEEEQGELEFVGPE